MLYGPDQRGIVAKTAGWIYEHGGNILHADQHRDAEECVFFQRIEWDPCGNEITDHVDGFTAHAQSLGMNARVATSYDRIKAAIFVSKLDHCFHDLIRRWKTNEYKADFVCAISNHDDLRDVSERSGIPYYSFDINSQSKMEVEQEQLRLMKEYQVELIILARYMQILSADFLNAFNKPIINIHHSFLPAFAGGKPYHQAYARGVKLIGATAHYATPILDDGPIIHQDTVRVTHRHSVEDMVRLGKNLEMVVLSQAVYWHLDHRVLTYGGKTVVFE